jgi:hypothetical protein
MDRDHGQGRVQVLAASRMSTTRSPPRPLGCVLCNHLLHLDDKLAILTVTLRSKDEGRLGHWLVAVEAHYPLQLVEDRLAEETTCPIAAAVVVRCSTEAISTAPDCSMPRQAASPWWQSAPYAPETAGR